MTDESAPETQQPTPAEAHRVEASVEASVEERVRAQLGRLADLDELPPAEHVERYGAVHVELQAALSEIDRDTA